MSLSTLAAVTFKKSPIAYPFCTPIRRRRSCAGQPPRRRKPLQTSIFRRRCRMASASGHSRNGQANTVSAAVGPRCPTGPKPTWNGGLTPDHGYPSNLKSIASRVSTYAANFLIWFGSTIATSRHAGHLTQRYFSDAARIQLVSPILDAARPCSTTRWRAGTDVRGERERALAALAACRAPMAERGAGMPMLS